MPAVTLTRTGAVWLLDLHGSETEAGGVFENRFNPDFVAEINAALDKVEAEKGTAALVTTSRGKIFSNGLDLEWMGAHKPEEVEVFMASFHQLLHRFMFFPVPTVAAVNGHAFAGGFMLALAHDYRVMRADRGYLCLNEIALGMNLTEGMNELVLAKAPDRHVLRAVLLQGKRFGAEEAIAARLVDEAVPEAEVRGAATELAAKFAGNGDKRKVYQKMKVMLYQDAFIVLAEASEVPDKVGKGDGPPGGGGKKKKPKFKGPRLTKYVPPRSRL